MKNVPEMLREAAATYEERNKLYGDNYKHFGSVMAGLFPKGIVASSVDDFNRLGVLIQVISKLTRYCENFARGGHDDSLLDMAVYSQMLRELDGLVKEQNELNAGLARIGGTPPVSKPLMPEDQRRHAIPDLPKQGADGIWRTGRSE